MPQIILFIWSSLPNIIFEKSCKFNLKWSDSFISHAAPKVPPMRNLFQNFIWLVLEDHYTSENSFTSHAAPKVPPMRNIFQNFIQNFIWLVPEDLLQKKEDWMLKKEDPWCPLVPLPSTTQTIVLEQTIKSKLNCLVLETVYRGSLSDKNS